MTCTHQLFPSPLISDCVSTFLWIQPGRTSTESSTACLTGSTTYYHLTVSYTLWEASILLMTHALTDDSRMDVVTTAAVLLVSVHESLSLFHNPLLSQSLPSNVEENREALLEEVGRHHRPSLQCFLALVCCGLDRGSSRGLKRWQLCGGGLGPVQSIGMFTIYYTAHTVYTWCTFDDHD